MLKDLKTSYFVTTTRSARNAANSFIFASSLYLAFSTHENLAAFCALLAELAK